MSDKNLMSYKEYFKGKKITVMGLGLLGRGLGDIKFLAECGADLIVTDLKTAEQLTSSVQKLDLFLKTKNLKPVTYVLGEHRLEDFANRDLIIKAAGVPLNSLYVAEAEKNKIRVAMSTALFAQLSGAKIIGITGTRGKSTTTQMIYEVLNENLSKVYLGGNVRGMSTLALLKKVKPEDWVVLELDSWQLQGFATSLKLRGTGGGGFSPHIAVFTNLLPDHLNYYNGDMEKYFADKSNIYKYQKSGDYLVCGPKIAPRLGVKPVERLPKDWKLKLPGEHNRENAALAKKVAEIVGVKPALIKKILTNFAGVAGRLELVCTVRGIKIYNDTTATTPTALIAALKALGDGVNYPSSKLSSKTEKKIMLIAGGAYKNLDFTEAFPFIKKYCKEFILLPGTGTEKLQPGTFNLQPIYVQTLKQAVEKAMSAAKRGDVILLSPGFASFGLFKNEFDRGDQFDKLVKKLV